MPISSCIPSACSKHEFASSAENVMWMLIGCKVSSFAAFSFFCCIYLLLWFQVVSHLPPVTVVVTYLPATGDPHTICFPVPPPLQQIVFVCTFPSVCSCSFFWTFLVSSRDSFFYLYFIIMLFSTGSSTTTTVSQPFLVITPRLQIFTITKRWFLCVDFPNIHWASSLKSI